MAGDLALLSLLDEQSQSWPVLAGGLLIGAGVAYAATPATDAIVAALPAAKQGVASALNDITRELGAVLGIAVLGSVFNATYRGDVGDATGNLPGDIAEAARDSLTAALQVAQQVGAEQGSELANVARAAFTTGMNKAMLVGVAVVVVGGVIAVLALPSHSSSETPQTEKQPIGAIGNSGLSYERFPQQAENGAVAPNSLELSARPLVTVRVQTAPPEPGRSLSHCQS